MAPAGMIFTTFDDEILTTEEQPFGRQGEGWGVAQQLMVGNAIAVAGMRDEPFNFRIVSLGEHKQHVFIDKDNQYLIVPNR